MTYIKNMNLKQLQGEVKRFRVIDKLNKHYNQEFELHGLNYKHFHYQNSEGYSSVNSYRGSSIFTFNFSQIQFLTPLKIGDRFIGIGDILIYNKREYEVYGYLWYEGEYMLSIARNKNYNDCYNYSQKELNNCNFTLKSEVEVEEMTLAQVNKLLGKTIKIIE